jgi:protein-S-isoprenylcysteine O-methyltransferase Ste14
MTAADSDRLSRVLLATPGNPAEDRRPRSASAAWTGLAGALAAIAAIVVLRDWLQPAWMKALAVVAVAAIAMVAVDIGIYGTPRNATTGLALAPLRRFDPMRFAQKLIGFWLTIGALALAYALLPVYAAAFFAPFRMAALWCLPALVVIAPVYIAFIDMRQREPVDAYAEIAMLIGGTRPADWTQLRVHALGWTVKGFFLPLMFSYVAADLDTLWAGPLLPSPGDFEHAFARAIDVFYLLDVLLAVVGYSLTLRLLDTHIRSAEPTAGGWVVCLACYPPFNRVTGTYLPFDQDGLYWGRVFGASPELYVLWGSLILALVFIYLWSTAAFGLRFSNLTHRGIITNGPYRWSKHPAYIAKNLSWWLISVPFIAGAGFAQAVQSCLLLGGVNLVYFLRARTEERHLSRDPVYRDYAAAIARDGLIARLSRWRPRAI